LHERCTVVRRVISLKNKLGSFSARSIRYHDPLTAQLTNDTLRTGSASASGYVTGWSLGGGRVPPPRRMTGPTGAEVATGGGGAGVGVGGGVGGAGWVMVVPNFGGGGLVSVGSIRSARLTAESRRGTPNGGRPSRSSTVLPMLTWEFQRLSIPGRTWPPNISSGTRGP